MTNFTSEHESERRQDYGQQRERYRSLRYPKNHIEIDNRLSWFLGTLDELNGDRAFYVHLLRDREEVAKSFLNRWDQRKTNIIFSFAWGVLTHPYDQIEQMSKDARMEVGRQYWDTVNSNIRLFLKDKPLQMTLWLHDIKPGFEEFWHRISAIGDLGSALETWDTPHNSSEKPAADDNEQDRSRHEITECVDTSDINGLINDDETTLREQCRLNDDVPKPTGEESTLIRNNQSVVERAMRDVDSVDLSQVQPPIEPGAWTLKTETLQFLVSLINHLNPEHVVEFGSGLSTRVLAWACGQMKIPSRITSVDHDPEFMDLTRASLNESASNAPVSFILAPIVARKFAGNVLSAYHLSHESSKRKDNANLIVIDGPPRALGGREAVLYQAMKFARPGTLVLLDDAKRADEKAAIAQWQHVLGSAIHVKLLPGFSKGLAAITIVRPVHEKDLPQHSISPVARRLRGLMQPDSMWILVDDCVLEPQAFEDRRVIPFTERNGEYWGPPATDDIATAELERLRNAGATFLTFVSSSFWWLDHYQDFTDYLESTYKRVVNDDDLIVFDIRKRCDETKVLD